MSTSGSVNYNVTRNDIISEALQICGVLEEGGTPTANQLSDTARTLNMLIKFWMTHGMELWLNEELVVFPIKNQRQYTFAISGASRMCREEQLVTTKLNGAHSANATNLVVDDTTDMLASDIIGVVTDTDGIHWTTIVSVNSSTGLTITTGLSAAASDNDRVYTYTTAFTEKVLKIHNGWITSTDESRIPINVNLSRQEYAMLSPAVSSSAGRINQLYYDPQGSSGLMNVFPVVSDTYTNDRIYLYVHRIVNDFDSATDDADFAQEWYLPLSYNLAMYIAPKNGVPQDKFSMISSLAVQTLAQVLNWDTEGTSIYIMPAASRGQIGMS